MRAAKERFAAQRNDHDQDIPKLESLVISVENAPLRALSFSASASTNGQQLPRLAVTVRKARRSLCRRWHQHAPSAEHRPSSVGIVPFKLFPFIKR